MTIFNEFIEYFSNYRNILKQIAQYGDNLEFETWIYSGTIKINDQFMLKTPDIYFDVIKYNVLLVGETRYRFTLHRESEIMRYPKNRKLFDRIFAPGIFTACNKKFKATGKQK
jgi:hypothetical protein